VRVAQNIIMKMFRHTMAFSIVKIGVLGEGG
jgi:hypothetical protein